MSAIKISIKHLVTICSIIVVALLLIQFVIVDYLGNAENETSATVYTAEESSRLAQQIGFYALKTSSDEELTKRVLPSLIEEHEQYLTTLKGKEMGEAFLPTLQKLGTEWSNMKRNIKLLLSEPLYQQDVSGTSVIRLSAANAFSKLEQHLSKVSTTYDLLIGDLREKELKQESTTHQVIFVFILLNAFVILGTFLLIKKFISAPLKLLAAASSNVAAGKFYQESMVHGDPHLQELSTSMHQISQNIEESAQFAENIGNGKFDFKFSTEIGNNRLFQGLNTMKEKLATVAEEDQKTNWTTKGLAQLGEILRSNQDNDKALSNEIISKLVKYLNVNQGSLFVLNDDDENDPYMELMACYAWDRKKFLEKRIEKGQGLVGQCWIEGDTIYLTDVPKNYVDITSGLGKATPTALLIVPLISNEEIFGVVELASFNRFEDFEIDFVKKIGENIASTLATTRINERTKILLEESQQQTEEMRAQEEEIRQNMEEMQATQEEMTRTQLEMSGTMNAINSSSAMIEFDPNGKILTANTLFLESLKYDLDEIRGRHHRLFVDSRTAESEEYSNFWKDLAAGKHKTGEFVRIAKDGSKVHILANYTPVMDDRGKVLKIIKIAQDITREKLKNINFQGQINAIKLSQAVIEFDLNGRILDANEIFLNTMGYGIEEIKGKHHSMFCDDDLIQSEEYQQLWIDLSKGKFKQGSFERIKKDGSTIHLSATYTPILNLEGEPYKVVKFAREQVLENV